MSNQFVSAIAEDASGQLWFGTFRGLNRFNSRDYFHYFSDSSSVSLPDNQIRSILRTHGGELYIGTVQGLCRLTEQDNFERIDTGDRHICDGLVQRGDSTIIFLSNYSRLCSYRPGDRESCVLLDSLNTGNVFYNRPHVNDDDCIWIAGDNNICRYDTAKHVLTDFVPTGMYCRNSILVNGHELWLTGSTLKMFDTRTRKFVPLPDAIVKHPVLGGAGFVLVHPYGTDGLLLLTTSDGMYYYDRRSGSVIGQAEASFPINVPDFKIKTIFTDSRQNIWFGGYDQGVAVHYHYTERFNHNKFVRKALENKSVVSVTTDLDNNLWMATRNDGIFVLDDKDKSLHQIAIGSLSANASAYDELIKNVFADSKGNLWLTLTNSETLRCHYDGNRLVVDKRYYIWASMSVTEDSNGRIWIGTASCYLAYLSDEDEFKYLQVFDPGFVFIPGLMPLDEDNIVVTAFNQPIKRVNIHTLEVSPLPLSDNSFESVLPRSVFIPTDLCVDRTGKLWVGTIANGLLKYDPADSTFTAVAGAANADISAIKQGRDSCLWISTLDGLSRYNPDTETFEHFFARDGIGGNQFYDRAAAVDSAGNIYFGGTHGITSFNPLEVSAKVSAPLVFQSLLVHNAPVRPGTGIIDRDISHRPEVRLDYSRNSFGISFVAVDYCENRRVAYRYKMDGIDDGWIEATDTREAYYANVAPGTYMFHVGINGDDKSTISLKIIIEGPWWTSWWAIMAYCIVFAAIAVVLFVAVMKFRAEREAVLRVRREKERERHINDMNMRFFANISHEFRTPLTMISGPIKQLGHAEGLSENDRHLLSIAKANVARMLNLVNQLLDFNKLENDTLPLEVERIDIAALLRQMTDIFANHAASKEIKFVTNGLEDNCFVTADADKLSKITANLLSNALKFTPRGGSVTVGLDMVDDSILGEAVKIYVRNTGAKIPSDKLEKIFERYYQLDGTRADGTYNCGSGIGLYYARALANLHHGRLFAVGNESFEGAEFVLLFPSSAQAYADDRHKGSPTQLDAYPLTTPPGGVSPMGADTADSSGRPLILVVDDDIQVAEYLRTLLSVQYRVVNRFDVDSALAWLDENTPPSLIISDLVMPGKDGYELCKAVKRDIRFCHIPIILLTAKATVESQVLGLEAEADAYLTKPFDPTLLISQIGSLLRNREKARQMINAGTTVDDVEADILSAQDSTFLQELYGLMEKELANCELDVNEIARLIHMSRTKFYYKVKGLTGEPPSVFFKTYKLNRAAELIREHKYTLSEIADMTGFSSLSHFSRSFKKQFGVAPTAYK